jgi:hypothetical protein
MTDDNQIVQNEVPAPPLIGVVVENEKPARPKWVGIELSFYIGKRIFIATIATIVLTLSLVTIKASKSGEEQILTVENRDQPNLFLGAFALYLLGVATDLDLTLPLRTLRGNKDD